MTEADIRALALFFYFALLDDRKAIECSIEALSICQEKLKREPKMKNSVAVISACMQLWKELQLDLHRGLPNTSVQSGWALPPGSDLGPWREFQKKAVPEELLCVIWSRITNYSEADIAKALNVSEGTVSYRLARAFRMLGNMVPKRERIHGL